MQQQLYHQPNVKSSSVPSPSTNKPVLANVTASVIVASSNIEKLYARPAVTLRVVAVKSPSAVLPNVTFPLVAASVIVRVVTSTLPSKIAEAPSVIVSVVTLAMSPKDVIAPVPASNVKVLAPPAISPSKSIIPPPAPVSILVF